MAPARFTEATHLIALALEGSSEAERQALTALVADAIGHDPEAATPLAALVQ